MAMKSSKMLFTVLVIMAILTQIFLSAATPSFEPRSGRFLAAMTCDKYPTVCRAKGSAGPYCCKKQCVDVMNDKLNCGNCGNKCNYSQICCKGRCVNPSNDDRNCGTCGHRCNKGSSCVYGLCSYA